MPETSFTYRSILIRKQMQAVSGAQFIRVLARSQIWIFIPVYLTELRGLPVYVSGVLFLLTAIIALPFSVYGGNLVDTLGRRKISLAIPIFLFALMMITAFSILYRANVVVIMAEFLAIEPISVIQWIADNAIVSDVTSIGERTGSFGILRIAGNLGFSAGPAIGGFLADYSYFYIFIFGAGGAIVEFLLYYFLVNETGKLRTSTGRFNVPFSDRYFIIVAALIGVTYFVSGQWGTTLTLFLSVIYMVPNSMIGILYSINGITVIALQMPIIRAIERFNGFNQLALGTIVYGIGFFILAFIHNIILLGLDIVLITIGENILAPVTNSIISKIAPEDRRGEYFGSAQLISGFISPLAPVMGTLLIYRNPHDPVMIWSPVLTIAIFASISIVIIGNRLMRSVAKR
ncbi:MFS transporter [Thermoplasma sp.]|uniref:MFS transporter n=1 Tax=Thermoplasma sp. TaxID=1973142 RepID=UPI002635D069|nr:MFS transporter [Thermoplasma sp.]